MDIGIKSHEESKTSVVDVFELSKNLRRDRHGIVCTLDHYNFIYQVRDSHWYEVSFCFVNFSCFAGAIFVSMSTAADSVLARCDKQVLPAFYQNAYRDITNCSMSFQSFVTCCL